MAMPAARRTDASRNREAILRAADDAFNGPGDGLSLVEIARRTGLGRATVYRHFPNRHALAAAFAARQLRLVREEVESGDGQPFLAALGQVLDVLIARPTLVALMGTMPDREQELHVRALAGILTPALRRAQAAGEVRADLRPEDIEFVMTMVEAAVRRSRRSGDDGEQPADVVARMVTVLLDGMRSPHAVPEEPGATVVPFPAAPDRLTGAAGQQTSPVQEASSPT